MPKPKNSKSRVVVVTGASAGVGRAIARAFGEEGAKVALLARGQDGLEAAKREIELSGGKALVLVTDVSDSSQVETAAQRIEEEFGPIDVWVNNAMVSVFSPIKEMLPEEFKRVTDVTYLGYVYGTLAALKRMLPRNCGHIIQVGSALAYRSIPLQSAYCAAKHAISGFTESLRSELLHDQSQVRVSEAQLPAVNTTQFEWSKSRMPKKPQPVPPIFQPEMIADAIVWLSYHPRRELQIAWPTVKAILADKVAPGLADRYLAHYGYESQMGDEPADPNRRDNLWEPVPGDHGAHGRFDRIAKRHSWALWASMHKRTLMALGTFAVAGLFSAWSLKTNRIQLGRS